ncbi:MAG: hypothetical protein IPF58_01425 [Saprospirales bacterium]|nr:hypothetical protein [Saprospirales bacterium]
MSYYYKLVGNCITNGDKVKDYVEKDYPLIKKKFVTQEKREGLGHAIWLTKNEIPKKMDVVIVLGDTIMDVNMKEFITSKISSLGIKARFRST